MRCDALEFCSCYCSKVRRSVETEQVDRLAGCDRRRLEILVGEVGVTGDDVVGADGSGEEQQVVILGVSKSRDVGLGVDFDPEDPAEGLDELIDLSQ